MATKQVLTIKRVMVIKFLVTKWTTDSTMFLAQLALAARSLNLEDEFSPSLFQQKRGVPSGAKNFLSSSYLN